MSALSLAIIKVPSNCFRQIGAVLGVSTLIVVLGNPSPDGALDVYRRAWALLALAGVIAALTGVALGRVRARHAGQDSVTQPQDGALVSGPLAVDEPVAR